MKKSILLILTFLILATTCEAQLGILRKVGKLSKLRKLKMKKPGKVGSGSLVAKLSFDEAAELWGEAASMGFDGANFLMGVVDGQPTLMSNSMPENSTLTSFDPKEPIDSVLFRYIQTHQTDVFRNPTLALETVKNTATLLLKPELLEKLDLPSLFQHFSQVKLLCNDGRAREMVPISISPSAPPSYWVAFTSNLYIPVDHMEYLTELSAYQNISVQSTDEGGSDTEKFILEITDPNEPGAISFPQKITVAKKTSYTLGEYMFALLPSEGKVLVSSDKNDHLIFDFYGAEGNPYLSLKNPTNLSYPDPPPRPSFSTTTRFVLGFLFLCYAIGAFWGLSRIFRSRGKNGFFAFVPVKNYLEIFEITSIDKRNYFLLLIPFYNLFVNYRVHKKLLEELDVSFSIPALASIMAAIPGLPWIYALIILKAR